MSVSECALTSSIWKAAGVCRNVFWMAIVCVTPLRFCGADTFRSGASIGMLLAGYSDVGIDVEICGSSRETHLLTWPQTEQVKPPTDIGKCLLPQHKWHCSVCPTECFGQNVLQTHLYVGIEGKPQNPMEICTSDFTVRSCFPKRLRVAVQLDGLHHITHITFATHIHSYIDLFSICAVNVKNCLD